MTYVAVVYESSFGNTRQIAEAVADGVREAGPQTRVAVLGVEEATPERLGQPELLIVGGPTHYRGMSRDSSRKKAVGTRVSPAPDQGHGVQDTSGAAGSGIREWLAVLPRAAQGQSAAAFDTRLAVPLAGGAARPIGRALRRLGFAVASEPQGFVVDGAKGPLRGGESDRAKAWGAGLVRRSVH
jgi:hypothetical protein